MIRSWAGNLTLNPDSDIFITSASQQLGEFLSTSDGTDLIVTERDIPDMREQNIEFVGTRLKPGTNHYTSWAGVDMIENRNNIIPKLLEVTPVSGAFQIGETVLGTDPNNDFDIFAVVQEIVSGVDISRSGQYYEINDPVTVIGGDGFAEMVVADVSKGRIDEIIIDDSGTGYTNGAQLQFDNSDTDGTGAEANVDIVGGSIQLENATSGDNIITDERESIVVNDVGDIEQEDATFENINIVLNRTATPHADAGDNIIIETPADPDNFITNHIQIENDSDGAVSYTHLPLPTKRIV